MPQIPLQPHSFSPAQYFTCFSPTPDVTKALRAWECERCRCFPVLLISRGACAAFPNQLERSPCPRRAGQAATMPRCLSWSNLLPHFIPARAVNIWTWAPASEGTSSSAAARALISDLMTKTWCSSFHRTSGGCRGFNGEGGGGGG